MSSHGQKERIVDEPSLLVFKIPYTGNIFIKQIENIGYVRGESIQRSLLRVIPIEVKFQTQIEMSAIVKVFAPVNMIAAVTNQSYLVGAPNSGVFEIMSSLQYPFIIDVTKPYIMSGSPAGLITGINDISNANECVSGSACVQRFRIPITINGACSFTGAYQASFKLACHPSITDPANCPLHPNNIDANVVESKIALFLALLNFLEMGSILETDGFCDFKEGDSN